jgi:hypothetical protein
MKLRREVVIWLLMIVTAVVTSFLVVQLTIRVTLATADRADLEAPALAPGRADYSADDGKPRIPRVAPDLSVSAGRENAQLLQAYQAGSSIILPPPDDSFDLGALLFASPTPIPTQLLRLPYTATQSASSTPGSTSMTTRTAADAATATASATWTATVTSLPTSSPIALAVEPTATPPGGAATAPALIKSATP